MARKKIYEVTVGLYADAMTPGIQALILEGADHRISGAKGCGRWNLLRKFSCDITVDLLRQADAARNLKGGRKP